MSKARAVDRFMGEAEAIALSVTGRLASWVAPLPTAIMAARSIAAIFTLPIEWAAAISAAQELIGLTTTSLYMTVKAWNATKRQSDPAANERLALGCVIGYFLVDFLIILIGAGIDYGQAARWYVFGAALFPFMGVIGVLVLNERVAQFRREVAVEEAKRAETEKRNAAKAERNQAKATEPKAKPTEAEPKQAKLRAFPEYARRTFEYYGRNPGASFAKAAASLEVSDRTIAHHVKALEVAGEMHRNGHGWEVNR